MRIFTKRSMVQKICIISLLCLTIPTLFFSFYLYKRQSGEFYKQLLQEQSLAIEQTVRSSDSILYSINELARGLAYSEPLNAYLGRQYRMGLEQFPIWSERQLNEVVSSIKYSLKYRDLGINAANIFTTSEKVQEGDYFWAASRLKNLTFFQEFASSNLSASIFYLNDENTAHFREVCGYTSISAEKETLLIIQKVNTFDENICMGYIIFECSPAKIFTDSFSSKEGNYFALFHNTRETYGNTAYVDSIRLSGVQKAQKAFTFKLDGEQHIGCSMKNFDITIVSAKPLEQDTYKLSSYSISGLLAAFALIQLFVLTLFIRSSFNQLHKDLNLMDAIMADGFHERIPEKRTDEIGMIAHRYNILLDKINSLIQETVEKETAQTHAQLKALQYQINPHFIYNTLSVFSGYASQNGQETLAESIASFGQLLRYTIKSDSLYATIDAELRCANSLISVYNIRYFNQLHLTVDVPASLRQFQIIKFLLQPLLENAILHGLDPSNTVLELQITIRQEDNTLIIQVSDNGKGMSAQRLSTVQNYMCNPKEELPDASNGSFIGLQNIYKRLKLFYGQNAQMSIDSEESCGTVITLRIPATTLISQRLTE